MTGSAEEKGCFKKALINNRKRILKFLFSEVGLTLVIVGYTVLGGLLFQSIELKDEKTAAAKVRTLAKEIETKREELIADFQRMGVEYRKLNRTAVVMEYNSKLNEYQEMLRKAIPEGYDGTLHAEKDEKFGWDTASAVLFAATILSTIGYGHVAPKSQLGRLVCILYAVLAVPLMSMFLMKVGGGVGRLVKLAYNRGCCFFCRRRRLEAHPKAREYVGDCTGSTMPVEKADLESDEEINRQADEASMPKLLSLFIAFVYLLIGSIIFYFMEGKWSMVQALYCGFVTMSTIGFGDLVPGMSKVNTMRGQLDLLFVAVFNMIGLAVVAMAINLVTDNLTRAAEDEFALETKKLEEKEPFATVENGKKSRPLTASEMNVVYDSEGEIEPPPIVH